MQFLFCEEKHQLKIEVMKINYNLLIALFILVGIGNANGQGWERVYSDVNGQFKHFRSCRQTTDLGYIFSGNHGGDFYIVKTDALGNVLWDHRNVMQQYEEDHDIIQTQDGGYIQVGKTQYQYGGHMLRYDANGNLLWQRSMPNDGNGGSYGILELADKSLMVWGSSNGPGATGGYDAFLTKHDSLGNVIWSKLHGSPTGWDQGRSIVQTSDGGFILSAYISNNGYDLWLLKVDANGDQEWSKIFDWPNSGGLQVQAVSAIITDDGGYLISGSPTTQGRLRLYKTDSQGTLQWTSQIGDPSDRFWGWLIRAHDGGYMAVGSSTRFGNGSEDVYLVKMDQNGQEQWSRTYGGDDEDRGRVVRTTADGGYIIAGDSKSFNINGQRDAYAIKVDSLGNIICGSTVEVSPSICTGDVWTVGSSTYSQTGTYVDTLVTPFGCDSIITTHLTVGNQINVVLNPQICVGDDFTVGTHTYNTSGTYVDTLTATFGCDSIVTTHLSVVNQIQTTLTPVLCSGETFTVGSSTYSSSGSYTDVFTSAFGCDSIVNTTLIVIPEYSATNNVTICQGETYTVGNSTYGQSGTYVNTVPCQMGCDSVLTTVLTVLQPVVTELNPEICQGDSFTVGTTTYTESGTYHQYYQSSATGCDSVVNINLTVHPAEMDTIYQTICSGESFTVGTSTYTESGTYTDTVAGSMGCYSVTTTYLDVLPSKDTTLYRRTCEGNYVVVGTGNWSFYFLEGTYTIVEEASNGCDSIITLHLEVFPNYHETISATICEGDTFSVGTYTHTVSGTYDDYFFAEGVCDSIITLNLTVLPGGGDTTIYASICDGESFTVGSHTYTETGIYEDIFTSPNGCDSVVTTHLTVGYGTDQFGHPLGLVTGTVFKDNDGGCVLSPGDSPLNNWVVQAENGTSAYGTTDTSGSYEILVPYGTYNVSTQTPANWDNCGPPSQSVTIDANSGCSTIVDLPLVPEFECALLDLDLSIICLVPCSTSTYHLNYHNIGTSTAYDPVITFVAGPNITVDWSSVPWLSPQSGDLYEFHLDSVPAGASGWIAIAVTVDCDANLEGYSVCSGAIHDASQCCSPYELYGGAHIELEAQCVNNDSIEFQIKNTGLGSMADNLDYFILQDDIIYATGTFFLPSQGVETIRVNATGHTYRLEAEQEPLHPYAAAPAISVEGCGTNVQGMVSLGYSDILENGDPIPSVDFNCTPITEDCNCNQLYGSPYGVDVQHYVSSGEQLEYIISFQNQGSVLSEDLVIIDTLPAELEPMSIIKGEASHSFEFSVTDGGVVKWIMKDINLAPGAPGTMENSGFVKFTANLKSDLLKGTVVTNKAYLHFDGNAGIPTNEVFHTIGERFVDFLIPLGVDDIKDPEHTLSVFPNPFSESTTLEITGVDARQIYIEIYDMEGRMVQQDVATNKHVLQIYRDGLADGMYTYRVMADGIFIGMGKLIVGGAK